MGSTTTVFSRFQRILLGTDGTVTHILEAYADEPIEAVKLAQGLDLPTPEDTALEVPEDATLLRRKVVLRGRQSGRNLLYAEAVVVASRVPIDMLDALLKTDQPIGRLLSERCMETFRQVLVIDREPAGSCAPHFGIEPAAELIFRTYRILARGKPMMLITEKFPANFFRAVAD